MNDNDPNKDWINDLKISDTEISKIDENIYYEPRPSKKRKNKVSSKIKYRWNNFKYNLRRKTHFKIRFSAGLLLGLFIPLCVALIVIYLLEPGISYLPQFYGTGNTIQLIL